MVPRTEISRIVVYIYRVLDLDQWLIELTHGGSARHSGLSPSAFSDGPDGSTGSGNSRHPGSSGIWQGPVHFSGDPGTLGEWPESLEKPVREMLLARGWKRPFFHQETALKNILSGQSCLIHSATASGKSLTYWAPILNELVRRPGSTALLLFPTKALARDQRRKLEELVGANPEGLSTLRPFVFDGDTPAGLRKEVREGANILITNPDTLHHVLLPAHGRWMRFLSSLKFVVLDECHVYKGVFGSHVSLVLRRLKRLCRKYGASIQWLASSATLGNPEEAGYLLTGETLKTLAGDSAPKGEKYFLAYRPPERRVEAVAGLALRFLEKGLRVILFAQSRLQCELLGRELQRRWKSREAGTEEVIAVYRAGYTAADRRKIESQLTEGALRCVVATCALELGVDIGHLDVALVSGFPRSLSSFRQQAGRAGRGGRAGVTVFVPSLSPLDSYLWQYPDYLWKGPEEAVYSDPGNPYLLERHLACASREFPLNADDGQYFGENFPVVIETLLKEKKIRLLREKWYPLGSPPPAFGLRSLGSRQYQVLDAGGTGKTLSTMDEVHFQRQVFPGSVHLIQGNSYTTVSIVEDLAQVYVEPSRLGYYTLPVVQSRLEWLKTIRHRGESGFKAMFGKVRQSASVEKLKRIALDTGTPLPGLPVHRELPELLTTACLLVPLPESLAKLKDSPSFNLPLALVGLQQILEETLPLSILCDKGDVQVTLETGDAFGPSVGILDVVPEGVGLAERAYSLADQVLAVAREVAERCDCEDGCPLCVGYDPLSIQGKEWIPQKSMTLELLRAGI